MHLTDHRQVLFGQIQFVRTDIETEVFLSGQLFFDFCDIDFNHISPIVTIIAIGKIFVKENYWTSLPSRTGIRTGPCMESQGFIIIWLERFGNHPGPAEPIIL